MATKNIQYKCIEEDEGLSIKAILLNRLKLSVKLMTKVKYHGDILLNGNHVTVRAKVAFGDTVDVIYPEEESWFVTENIPIDVRYEDDDIMLVNKDPGLIVHPTYNFPNGTLANAITYHMQQKGEVYKLRFINRLDMNTSGLVIVGKNAHSQDNISNQMNQNQTVKQYIAIVHGIIEGSGTIDEPIDRDPNHKARRMVTPSGYRSITHYESLETHKCSGLGSIDGYTLLKLKLDTGRTHQIRVHLTHIGHPIVGDELYGQLFGYELGKDLMDRQALHASHIELNHPVSGERIIVDADIPLDMKKCWEFIKTI